MKKEKKEKKIRGKGKLTKRGLSITLYVVLIILISLISFVGIYVRDKNKMSNKLPEYILGTDMNGMRNIVVKVDDSTKTKSYDAQGKEIDTNSETNTTKADGVTTKEVPANDKDSLTIDNYQKSNDIILKRLQSMNVQYCEEKFDQNNGTIYLEVPENTNTDSIAQYCITKGEFKISDNDTGDVLFTNSDIQKATVGYSTETSGTAVYLNIQFNKNVIDKVKDMSDTYVKTTGSDGKEVSKQIKMTLDDQTIMSTYFGNEINDGLLQLQVGTGTDQSKIQDYVKQASNLAIFLNSEPMPITYKMDTNRFVFSNITNKNILTIVIALSSIFVLMLIWMIIKNKKQGFLGAITNIGFLALLIIIIRYTNVTMTITGIFGIAVATIIEYAFLMNVFKTYNKKLDKENKNQEMKHTINSEYEKILPVAIISIVFTVTKWEPIFSIGMILFWASIELVIYNYITLKIICKKEV